MLGKSLSCLEQSTHLARLYHLSLKNPNQLIAFLRKFRKLLEDLDVDGCLFVPGAFNIQERSPFILVLERTSKVSLCLSLSYSLATGRGIPLIPQCKHAMNASLSLYFLSLFLSTPSCTHHITNIDNRMRVLSGRVSCFGRQLGRGQCRVPLQFAYHCAAEDSNSPCHVLRERTGQIHESIFFLLLYAFLPAR